MLGAAALVFAAGMAIASSAAVAPPRHRLAPSNARAAWKFRQQMRAYPNSSLDLSIYERAIAQRDRMSSGLVGLQPNTLPPPPQPSPGQWSFIGPQYEKSPSQWGFGPGDVNGRINNAAFDPQIPGTWYVAAPAGGVWKTTDFGSHWLPMTDALPSLAFSSVAIDPTNSNIVYAGSGDYDGEDAPATGLWKSTTGGTSWSRIDPVVNGVHIWHMHTIRSILVDPNDHTHLMVALGRDVDLGLIFGGAANPHGAIAVSHDSGATWTSAIVVAGYFNHIVANANHTGFFASADFGGVYRSTDGDHWTHCPGIPSVGPTVAGTTHRIDVAASVIDPNTIFVLSEDATGVFRSTDAGNTFTNVTNNLPDTFTYADLSLWGQAFYDFYISSSKASVVVGGVPITRDVIVVGLLDIVMSVDEGTTWQTIAHIYTGNDLTHTDQHEMVFNPSNPAEALCCNDGGVYHFTYDLPTNKFTYSSLNDTLGVTEFYAGAPHPNDLTYMLGGCQDDASPRAPFDLSNWDNIFSGDGGGCAISNVYPYPPLPTGGGVDQMSTQYASAQFGAFVITDDYWNTGAYIPLPITGNVLFEPPLEISQANPAHLYSGSNDLAQYTWAPGYAGTWASLFSFPDTNDIFTAAGPSSTNDAVVYAGSIEGVVAATVRGPFAGPKTLSNLPLRSISALKVGLLNPQRVYAALSGSGVDHVWRCDDTTVPNPVWVDISGTGTGKLPDVPITCMELLPRDDEQQLWVGTDIGVFFTTNGGLSWQSANQYGLPNVAVNALHFQPSTGYIEAATFGRGMWRLRIGKNQPFYLQPLLQSYVGNRSTLPIRLQFFHYNENIIEDPHTGAGATPPFYDPYRFLTPPVEDIKSTLSPAGYYVGNISSVGNYDIFITVPRFLRKNIAHQLTGNQQLIKGVLIAGDVCGWDPRSQTFTPPDNVIDVNDELFVLNQIMLGNIYQHGLADVNGDGIVNQLDLNIIAANIGKVGD